MKICFVSLKNYPLFNPSVNCNFGGAETQLYNLSTKLAEDPQYDVSMIVNNFGQPEMDKINCVSLFKYMEHHPFLDKIKWVRYVAKLYRLYKVFKKVNADIYIQRCKNDLTIYTAFFCRLLQKKYLFMVASEADVLGKTEKDLPLFNRAFHTYGIKRADLILVQNKEQQESLLNNFGLNSSIQKSVCPIGKIEKMERKYILWVGRAVPLKQPEILFELSNQNPDKDFVMICRQVPYEAKYFQGIKTAALKIKNIKFLDHVPFDEIGQYFKKAKVFINTSTYEGFPNTFIESWKNGVPVLSLNVNPDEIITKFSLGFCSKTLSQLNMDLNTLYSNDILFNEKAGCSYDYVLKNHNVETIIEEFKNHLTSLIN